MSQLLVVLGGAMISCFFSVLEYAFRFYSISKFEDQIDDRNEATRDRYKFILDRDVYFQYANALLSIVGLAVMIYGMVYLGAPNTDGQLSHGGADFATLLASLLLLLFFSKTLLRAVVKQHAEAIVWRTLWLVRLLHVFMLPMTAIAVMIEEKLFHAGEDEATEAEDAIMSLVNDGEIDGTIEGSEREMIEGVFELADTPVGQVMTQRTEIKALDVSVSLEVARQFVLEHGHSRIPAYEEDVDNIVGILYSRDILNYLGKVEEITVGEISRTPLFVPESKKVDELLEEFRKQKTHIGVVLDEYGGTSGLVTIEDILEEIVGEIEDEYDKDDKEAPIRQLGPNLYEVDARTEIEELNKALDLSLDEDADYDTIGGFLIYKLERIPKTGDALKVDGLACLVVQASARKVEKIRIELVDEKDGERESS